MGERQTRHARPEFDVRDARLEAGWVQRMREARVRLEIIISREVVLVVRLPPLALCELFLSRFSLVSLSDKGNTFLAYLPLFGLCVIITEAPSGILN